MIPKLRFLRSQSICPGNLTTVLPCKNGYCCKLELVRAKSILVLQYSCNFSAVGGTVIHIRSIAVVPTVLEKFMFYEYLNVASVSLGILMQFVHCCLVTAKAFMPASVRVIP